MSELEEEEIWEYKGDASEVNTEEIVRGVKTEWNSKDNKVKVVKEEDE